MGWHEESGVSTDLTQLRISETVFDDTVDETECHRMILHLGVVKIVKKESGAFFNHDCVVAAIERRGGLERDLMFDS